MAEDYMNVRLARSTVEDIANPFGGDIGVRHGAELASACAEAVRAEDVEDDRPAARATAGTPKPREYMAWWIEWGVLGLILLAGIVGWAVT